MTHDDEDAEIERIAAFVDARVLRGHPRHPVGCLCIPCNMVAPTTTGMCVYCGHWLDSHDFRGDDGLMGEPRCKGGAIA